MHAVPPLAQNPGDAGVQHYVLLGVYARSDGDDEHNVI